jgi:hypothetical protein
VDRHNFYYRELVTEATLDQVFDWAEDADGKIKQDAILPTRSGAKRGAVHVGGVVSQNASPDLNVLVSGPGLCSDPDGKRVYWPTTQTINCSVDYLGSPTDPGVGNRRYLSIFAEFDRMLADQITDGTGNPVWTSQYESFKINVIMGTAADVGLSMPPAPATPTGSVRLANIVFVGGGTQILNADIEVDTASFERDDWARFTGTNASDIVAGDAYTTAEAMYSIIDSIAGGGATFTSTSQWNDATSLNSPQGMSDAVNQIVDLLGSQLTGNGANKIGVDLTDSGGWETIPAGSIKSQLTALLDRTFQAVPKTDPASSVANFVKMLVTHNDADVGNKISVYFKDQEIMLSIGGVPTSASEITVASATSSVIAVRISPAGGVHIMSNTNTSGGSVLDTSDPADWESWDVVGSAGQTIITDKIRLVPTHDSSYLEVDEHTDWTSGWSKALEALNATNGRGRVLFNDGIFYTYNAFVNDSGNWDRDDAGQNSFAMSVEAGGIRYYFKDLDETGTWTHTFSADAVGWTSVWQYGGQISGNNVAVIPQVWGEATIKGLWSIYVDNITASSINMSGVTHCDWCASMEDYTSTGDITLTIIDKSDSLGGLVWGATPSVFVNSWQIDNNINGKLGCKITGNTDGAISAGAWGFLAGQALLETDY